MNSGLEELHSTLQFKGLTVENWLSYPTFSSWPTLREVTVFLFVSTYLISTVNLWRRGTASCEHTASSSEQESKLPGRMGLCRLNSHLSGSLLVFRRKMSPVKRKKKTTTKQETQHGWRIDNKRKMYKEFEERSRETKGRTMHKTKKQTKKKRK